MKNSKSSSQFVESVFTPFSLVLISIVAIVAVAVALFQVNRGPLAPTAPQSQPQAADITSNTCALTFVVGAASPTPTNTPGPDVADLDLQKTVDDSSVNVGQQVTFTVSVHNAGPNPATGVTVEDILPTGLSYVSSSPTGQYNNTTGIWTIPGSIAVNQTVSLQIVATVTQSGELTNYAQIATSDQEDIDSTPGNDSGTGTTPHEDDDSSVPVNSTDNVADLELTKRASNNTPTLGGTTTFSIDLLNKGPQTATNVTVTDIIPAGLSYLSHVAPTGTTFNSATGVWTIPSISVDTTLTLTITVQVNQTGTIVNYAQVSDSDQPDPDSTPNDGPQNPDDDDDDDEIITVPPVATNTPTNTPVVNSGTPVPTATPTPSADLRLNKTVSNSTPRVGDEITYTIEVYNAGPNDATGVTVREPLAGGLTYVRYSASQGTYDVNTGIWNIGTVRVNETKTLNITVRVNVSSAITNISQVQTSDQPDPNSTPGNSNPNENDQDTATTNPEAQGADLSLIKRVNNSRPKVGDNITYTIEVHNSGPRQADNVSVRDLIPDGTQYVSGNPTQGTYDVGPGVWTIGSIPKDFTVSLELTVKVIRDGNILNVAEVVSSSQPDPDSTPNNNNPNEDDQDDALITTLSSPVLPKAGNTSRTTLFVIATGVIVLIIGAMGLLLLL